MRFFRLISSDRGSAVVEFVLLAPLMFVVSLATILIGVNSYSALMIRAAVIEAANYGALADQSEVSACSRFQDLLPARLISNYRLTIQCSKSNSSGSISVQAAYFPPWNIPFGSVRSININSESRSELSIGN